MGRGSEISILIFTCNTSSSQLHWLIKQWIAGRINRLSDFASLEMATSFSYCHRKWLWREKSQINSGQNVKYNTNSYYLIAINYLIGILCLYFVAGCVLRIGWYKIGMQKKGYRLAGHEIKKVIPWTIRAINCQISACKPCNSQISARKPCNCQISARKPCNCQISACKPCNCQISARKPCNRIYCAWHSEQRLETSLQ